MLLFIGDIVTEIFHFLSTETNHFFRNHGNPGCEVTNQALSFISGTLIPLKTSKPQL
jgi:hypothetical protein